MHDNKLFSWMEQREKRQQKRRRKSSISTERHHFVKEIILDGQKFFLKDEVDKRSPPLSSHIIIDLPIPLPWTCNISGGSSEEQTPTPTVGTWERVCEYMSVLESSIINFRNTDPHCEERLFTVAWHQQQK